jgi:hypothetical protein
MREQRDGAEVCWLAGRGAQAGGMHGPGHGARRWQSTGWGGTQWVVRERTWASNWQRRPGFLTVRLLHSGGPA